MILLEEVRERRVQEGRSVRSFSREAGLRVLIAKRCDGQGIATEREEAQCETRGQWRIAVCIHLRSVRKKACRSIFVVLQE